MDLFRKSALQRMLSPEQLDQLIKITKPRDWIALLGICAIIIAFIIWSIIGSISINISGIGIFLKPGGISAINSPFEGEITKVSEFSVGDIIKKGQVIAEISQPNLDQKINSTTAQITKLENDLQNTIKNKGDTKAIETQITALKSQLSPLETKLHASAEIVSPITGSFLHTRVKLGSYVHVGEDLITVENETGNISATLFLPPNTTHLENIKKGMFVKIYPGLGENVQNGYLIGQVDEITKFPASPQVLNSLLNNEYLVKFFSQSGPPYILTVNLISDPNTLNGYKWSSDAGKMLQIKSGSFCSGTIQVFKERPINFILPILKKNKE